MASPPFNINQALPGDTDIVSQHPGNARSFRDIVESWLLVNHNTSGYHSRIDISRATSPTTPASGVDLVYTTATGRLKIKHSDGSEEFVGVPPGTIIYSSALSTPAGWLLADGSAVSRAAFPDLYAEISTAYGAGDGSTTFNLPDLRGRSPIGVDAGAGRISTATMNAVTISGVGGSETRGLIPTNIPSGVGVNVTSLTGNVTVSSIDVNVSGTISGSSTGSTASGSVTGTASGGAVTGSSSGTVTGTASVTSTIATILRATTHDNYSSVAGDAGPIQNVTNGTITSNGNILATFSSGSISGSLSTPATVSGSFTGAAVTNGSVTGTFSGTGTGNGTGTATGTGSGTTTGTNPGTAFSIMQPSMVLYPLIKA